MEYMGGMGGGGGGLIVICTKPYSIYFRALGLWIPKFNDMKTAGDPSLQKTLVADGDFI